MSALSGVVQNSSVATLQSLNNTAKFPLIELSVMEIKRFCLSIRSRIYWGETKTALRTVVSQFRSRKMFTERHIIKQIKGMTTFSKLTKNCKANWIDSHHTTHSFKQMIVLRKFIEKTHKTSEEIIYIQNKGNQFNWGAWLKKLN